MTTEDSDMWKAHNEDMKQMREKRNDLASKDLETLAKTDGIRSVYITPYQIRIEEVLDIWPSNKNYHDIQTNERGRYRRLIPFVRDFFSVVTVPNQ